MRSRPVLFVVVLCACGSVLLLIIANLNHLTHLDRHRANNKVTPASLVRRMSAPPTYKHVTKSLAELGRMDDVSRHVLFVNAIPNSGAEILALLLKWLQGWNNFKHIKLRGSKKRLNPLEIEAFVYETCDAVRDEAVPISFDRGVYFVNFTRLDRQSPTFLNLLRDPAEYFLSRFHHIMQDDALRHLKTAADIEKCMVDNRPECRLHDGVAYDLAVPYFCGQDAKCQYLNNDWALKRAQTTVEKYYGVVGVLDELNATLVLLEHALPYFFKSASTLYYRDLLQPFQKNRNKTPKVTAAFRARMRNTLRHEYTFYDWIKSRLFHQLQLANTSGHR